MNTVTLHFEDKGKEIAASCSALVRIGDSIFAAGDEGVHIARLEQAKKDKSRYALKELIDLRECFELPLPEPVDETKPSGKIKKVLKEVDVEGMDFDEESGLLWLLGSHSWKRAKAEAGDSHAENLRALETVGADGNRFFIGRMPLTREDDDRWRIAPGGPDRGKLKAAQVATSATGNDLIEALRGDSLLKAYLSGETPTPGKDNGLDFEGLVCAGKNRVLTGLRGPVLRGIAIILELEFSHEKCPGSLADGLRLKAIGPKKAKYRRHFVDLNGLGIRDLCWAGDGRDLMILAGPTMVLDAPPRVFRWKDARAQLNLSPSEEERFFWREEEIFLTRLKPEPAGLEPGRDRAESLSRFGGKKFVIGYDTDGGRLENGTELSCDVVSVKMDEPEEED